MIDFDRLKEEAAKEPISATEIYGKSFLDECVKEAHIDRTTHYKGDKFILTFDEDNDKYAPVMSLGNISTTIGPAKSKKTFFSTMITSAFSDGHKYGMKGDLCGRKLLYIDTEQGNKHVQKIIKRVWNIAGTDERMEIFALRKYYEQRLRLALIEHILSTSGDAYSIVIIDGIVDLMKNYNDLTEAQELVGKIMSWTELFNCHINCVVHVAESSGKARGHIGTELMNKSETVFKLTPDESSSKVECAYARNRPFTSFDFMINDEALPCRLDYPQDTEDIEDGDPGPTDLPQTEIVDQMQQMSIEYNAINSPKEEKSNDDFLNQRDDTPF